MDSSYISMLDMYIAYRKCKYEAYHSSNVALGLKFAEFENHLEVNLRAIREQVLNNDRWWEPPLTIASLSAIPKEGSPATRQDVEWFFLVSEVLDEQLRSDNSRPTTAYRKIIEPSIALLVISSLWVCKVGVKLDVSLSTDNVYANRLRKIGDKLATDSHKLFKHWGSQYKAWQQNAMDAMAHNLKDNRDLLVFSMDIQQYYHEISPAHLTRALRIDQDPQYTANDLQFTNQICAFYSYWNEQIAREPVGIPVGLSCSAVIANALLKTLDEDFESLEPVFYGRYVDDILLAIPLPQNIRTGRTAVRSICKRVASLTYTGKSGDSRVVVHVANHEDFNINKRKFRAFALKGDSGRDFLAAIEEALDARSSEQRLREPLQSDEVKLGKRALLLHDRSGKVIGDIKSATSISLRRAAFSQILQQMEQYCQALEPKEWANIRRAFVGLFIRHCLTFDGMPIYFRRIPSVIALLCLCKDNSAVSRILTRLQRLKDVEESELSGLWWKNLASLILEACLSVGPVSDSTISRISRLGGLSVSDRFETEVACSDLHLADFGYISYAAGLFDGNENSLKQKSANRCPDVLLTAEHRLVLDSRVYAWEPVMFPTRSPSVHLLASVVGASNITHLNRFLRVFCGYELPQILITRKEEYLICGRTNRDSSSNLQGQLPDGVVRVALGSVWLSDDDLSESPAAARSPGVTKFHRMKRIIADTLRCRRTPQYLVLPELCMPRQWLPIFAEQLAQAGITLVTGLEYRFDQQVGRINEAVATLCFEERYSVWVPLYFRKRRPAWVECSNFDGDIAVCDEFPEIVLHKGLAFSVVICSDFTDIDIRARLRGGVDCLFVLEWNQDTDSFAKIVESAALDMHCLIVQSNNSKFGDCWMRAPFKERYKRDIVKIKGGEEDYVVVGSFDYLALRDFQRMYGPGSVGEFDFKPPPIGFSVKPWR